MKRFIIRRVEGREIRVDITNCFWCGDRDHVCAACVAKANRTQDKARDAALAAGLATGPRR